jgi:hypothetical protein
MPWLDLPVAPEFWLRDARIAAGFLAAPLPRVPIDAEGSRVSICASRAERSPNSPRRAVRRMAPTSTAARCGPAIDTAPPDYRQLDRLLAR